MKLLAIGLAAAGLLAIAAPAPAAAHGGGLNSAGCHNERRTGGYHCHRAGQASPRARAPRRRSRSYRRGRR
jgi:hypothetical protein